MLNGETVPSFSVRDTGINVLSSSIGQRGNDLALLHRPMLWHTHLRTNVLRGQDQLCACVDGPSRPFALANEFRRTISASVFVSPDF